MDSDIYAEYTGSDNGLVIKNLKYLAQNVPTERLHIRVPKIEGFNTDKDIENSVAKLKEIELTNIEVFEYIVK